MGRNRGGVEMNAEKFIEQLQKDVETSKEPFISNMKNLNMEDKTFCEWIKAFSAWMEWSTDMCDEYNDA